jgi:hypothetical protein
MRPGRHRKQTITMPCQDWLDATSERMARAREDGLEPETVDHLTPSGFKTGTKNRLIRDPIENALTYGRISEGQARAGAIFMKNLYQAQVDGRVTADLLGESIRGSISLNISPLRLLNLKQVMLALESLEKKYRNIWLEWCSQVLTGRAGVEVLGRIAYQVQQKVRKDRQCFQEGSILLNLCLSRLQEHYGC